MRISEIFYSLQGEGFLAGTPSSFVRLAGCPLRCRWCDTKYAWHKNAGQLYSINQIIRAVQRYPARFVVITGGEPMTDPELPRLLQQLKNRNKHITIETAGITFRPDLPCNLMSISPKLSNAVPPEADLAAIHANNPLDTTVLSKLTQHYEYQLKFVVDSTDDLPEIRHLLKNLKNIDPAKVMLMPQAATRNQLLAKSPMVADLCRKAGFVFSTRLQVLLWNNKRGT